MNIYNKLKGKVLFMMILANKLYLMSQIGKEIIRIGPNQNQDYSMTYEPVKFLGFNSHGEMMVEGDSVPLPPWFNDGLWRSISILETAKKTALHDLKGKMIHRIRPVYFDFFQTDPSFLYYEGAYQLVSATKYHVVLLLPNGRKTILDGRFTNPLDWEEVKN